MAISTLALVERQTRLRADTDREMSYGMFWLWTLVLGAFTLGLGALVYAIAIGFQLLNRRNDHFARQHRLFRQVLDGLRERYGRQGAVATRLDSIEGSLRDMEMKERRKDPWLWVLLLPLLTFGIAGFWTQYWLTRDWRSHAQRQQQVTSELSAVLRETGHPAPNLIDDGATPDRNFWLYLLFFILTVGWFGIWWEYVIFRDGNVHMRNDAFMEDQLLNALRGAA